MSKGLSLLDFIYLNKKTDLASTELKNLIKTHGSLEYNISQHLRLIREIPKLYKRFGKKSLKNNSTYHVLVKTIREFEDIIDRYIKLMFKSGEVLPAAIHGYVRYIDLFDSLGKPELKDKEKIEQIEKTHAGLNNIIRIQNNKIKRLIKRTHFKLGDLSDQNLENIADETRKRNGKINYSAMGRKLGISRETIRREINKRSLTYLIEAPTVSK